MATIIPNVNSNHADHFILILFRTGVMGCTASLAKPQPEEGHCPFTSAPEGPTELVYRHTRITSPVSSTEMSWSRRKTTGGALQAWVSRPSNRGVLGGSKLSQKACTRDFGILVPCLLHIFCNTNLNAS